MSSSSVVLNTDFESVPTAKSLFNIYCFQGPSEQALADHPGKAALFLRKEKLGDADFHHGDTASHHFLKHFLYLHVSCKMDLLLNLLTEQQRNLYNKNVAM